MPLLFDVSLIENSPLTDLIDEARRQESLNTDNLLFSERAPEVLKARLSQEKNRYVEFLKSSLSNIFSDRILSFPSFCKELRSFGSKKDRNLAFLKKIEPKSKKIKKSAVKAKDPETKQASKKTKQKENVEQSGEKKENIKEENVKEKENSVFEESIADEDESQVSSISSISM